MVTALGRRRSTALGLKEEFSVNLHKYSFSAPTNDVPSGEETNRCRSFIHEHYQGLVQGSDTIARPQTKYHMKELTGVFQAMPGSYQKLNVLASSLGYFKLTEDYFKTLSLSYTPN